MKINGNPNDPLIKLHNLMQWTQNNVSGKATEITILYDLCRNSEFLLIRDQIIT